MKRSDLITLTTDFGVQTQGIGTMEGVIYRIAPQAKVIHLMHGLPEFNIVAAARTMEALRYFPIGNHVCVCDPGVGTTRKALAVLVARGDVLIGPDNGVLLSACGILGGITRAHELSNPEFMNQPVSPIFHGRDIFAPAAAHLVNGVSLESFGVELQASNLTPAPFVEAEVSADKIHAQIIQINRFGSIHLNITHEVWDSFNIRVGDYVEARFESRQPLRLPVCNTFGDVAVGEFLIMRDDYGRVEIAKNLGSFVGDVPVNIGQNLELTILASRNC